jgi:glycosyltransferase involved in cell wall biosynthesis
MIKYGDRIEILMITKNEELAVKKVITDIKKIDNRINILIVDSSSDSTGKIAIDNGAKVIFQNPPKGYGPAMHLAFINGSREILITMDCDDTYPVNKIELFSEKIIEEKFDVVDGNRLKVKPASMPLINYLANYAFALFSSFIFFRRVRDLHSGMRAYKKEVLKKIPYKIEGVSLPVELILWPIRLGFKVCIVDIDYKERIGSSKLEPIKAAYWTLIRILRARFLKVN